MSKSISGNYKTEAINSPLNVLTVTGNYNKVTILSKVKVLYVSGNYNEINGLDPNCLVDIINSSGNYNKVRLNQNCSNVKKNVSGNSNEIIFNDNYYTKMNFEKNDNNTNYNMNETNNYNNNTNNYSNNYTNNNTNNTNTNDNDNDENLSEYDKKKKALILEMDEYQYKHIQKYDSRKEKECAICLNEFIGVDIIKAFYKCEHIFHKTCLLDWLKKSDSCPLCNHNLKDDIK